MTDLLAIDGGVAVRSMPMPAWPAPAEDEIAAVERVLRSGRINYWTGTEGRSLELEYAQVLGRTHAVAVANGTLALELALRAYGIGAGDEVVIPARTFIATAGAVVAAGATPVCADVDLDGGVLTADTLRAASSERTAALIPVHLGGWPVDMDPVLAFARERDLVVIEDCAQAHGGAYGGRPLGSLGDAAAFSFCQDKIVACGEGGLLALDDEDAYVRAWEYKDHGKSLAKTLEAASGESWGYRWLHDGFGTNWRLPETEAAMARVQLRRLDASHNARTRNARRLASGLAGTAGLRVPLPPAHSEHAFYRLYAYLDPHELLAGWDRDRVAQAVQAEGVPCQYGACAEVYREQAFVRSGLGPAGRLPNAASIHETSLAFLVHPTLSDADIDDVIAAVRKVMKVAAE